MPTYNNSDFYPATDQKVSQDGIVIFNENTQGVLLTSQTRTSTTTSGVQSNYNSRGVYIFLNVTTASGTGGLTLRIMAQEPVTGNFAYLNGPPTTVTTVGMTAIVLYPGASGTSVNVTQSVGLPLP